MHLRDATARDINAIAALHAQSWQRNYRGALSDDFLDGPVVADRLQKWTARLQHGLEAWTHTNVALERGVVVGFVHTIFDADPSDGALLENLHVSSTCARRGFGRALMSASARATLAARPGQSLHLTVLQQNVAAQAFYDAQGGDCRGTEPWRSPSGEDVRVLRYVWPDPSVLLD